MREGGSEWVGVWVGEWSGHVRTISTGDMGVREG